MKTLSRLALKTACLVAFATLAACSAGVVVAPGENDVCSPSNLDGECTVGDICFEGACVATSDLCSDGVQNVDETGVDCGGACDACNTVTCDNGVEDGNETGVDCGGDCPACPDPCTNSIQDNGEEGIDCGGSCTTECVECTSDSDCDNVRCDIASGSCSPAACDDGFTNGSESDLDCGGSCDACSDGGFCVGGADCESLVCGSDLTCAVPTCSDGERNGDENATDCGGLFCGPCGGGAECTVPSECDSGVCFDGFCSDATCVDGVTNGNETGLDCGGDCLLDGKTCAVGGGCDSSGDGSDCASGVCQSDVCRDPNCGDGIRNGSETEIDCGGAICGPCETEGDACAVAADCASGVCTDNACVAAACDDGLQNGSETGLDCGGDCTDCPSGQGCADDDDCAVGASCDAAGVCRNDTCTNSQQDGDETGVDCGGTCAACGGGGGCSVGDDCVSGVCGADNLCAEPSCTDGIRNGLEGGVDCGAVACALCGQGDECSSDFDCTTGRCGPTSQTCVAPSCSDSVQNGSETGVDCGGPCGSCPDGAGCSVPGDCDSGICTSGTCADPTCTDSVSNGQETGVDCGGNCVSDGLTCGEGEGCGQNADCDSGQCSGGQCVVAHCTNSTFDPGDGETDVDCGGSCAPCNVGQGCDEGGDCLAGSCGVQNNCLGGGCSCQLPACDDGVLNGTETGVDCGGLCADSDQTCDDGSDCGGDDDCSSGVCDGGRCQAPSCDDSTQNGDETGVDCGGGCVAEGLACDDGATCVDADDCGSSVCSDGSGLSDTDDCTAVGGGTCCQPAACGDGIQNGTESGVDCGGSCGACPDGGGCGDDTDCASTVCNDGVAPDGDVGCTAGTCCVAACDDTVSNGAETGVDCGGPDCGNCADGQACDDNADCVSDFCSAAGVCADASCNDGSQNGTETDLNCGGGVCPGCAAGGACVVSSDCADQVCSDGTTLTGNDGPDDNTDCSGSGTGLCCQASSCSDGLKNGDETGVDCGGSCISEGKRCGSGVDCAVADDCGSQVCSDGSAPSDSVACSGASDCCQPAVCNDNTTNGTESDVDCGGVCGGCVATETCGDDSDCASNVCNDGVAPDGACSADECCAATCSDGVKNADEGDVDCGGTGTSCPAACGDGATCNVDADCESDVCDAGICQAPACGDGKINQGSEVCDDGNTDSCVGGCLDDCSATVSLFGCRDGVLCGAEVCDDGDNDDTNNCRNDCSRPACQDGFLSTGATGIYAEACDDGDAVDDNNCRNDCTEPQCGDGFHSSSATGGFVEACDDGNTDDCSGGCLGDCSATVTITGCGDGVQCGTEACDDGNTDSCTGSCLADCSATIDPGACGNGVICGAELCDAANTPDSSCVDEGFTSGNLQCNLSCDGYELASCFGGCGNGRIEGSEVCEAGLLGGNTCASMSPGSTGTLACANDCGGYDLSGCTDACGNGVVDGAEECDGAQIATSADNCDDFGGASQSITVCNADCTVDRSACVGGCGDGLLDAGEECDGAAVDSAFDTCTENGFSAGTLAGCNADCTANTSSCWACDGATLDPGEVCDGTNFNPNFDECGEVGFTAGTIGPCLASCQGFVTDNCTTCGNNNQEGAESCDLQDLAGMDCSDFTDPATLQPFDGGALACDGDCGGFDVSACRSCGVCGSGEACVDGECVCATGSTDCGGTCVATTVDPDNCGGCGVACDVAGGEVCSGGTCVAGGACLEPLMPHEDGRCIDPATDDTYCGATNRGDGVYENGTDCTLTSQVCNAGTCVNPLVTLNDLPECSGGGEPISVGTGGSLDCAGDLASVSFRWAICSCNNLSISQGISTDGYDSSAGPYDPANRQTGGGVGTNGMFGSSGEVYGTLWAAGSGGISTSATLDVRQNTYSGGDAGFKASYFAGDMFIKGDISQSGSGSTLVGGQVYQSSGASLDASVDCGETLCATHGNATDCGNETGATCAWTGTACEANGCTAQLLGAPPLNAAGNIPNACDCNPTQLVDTAGIVDDHACLPQGTVTTDYPGGCSAHECCRYSNNSNYAAGLDPTLLTGTGGRIDLDCGHYYFEEIDTGASSTIFAHGNVAIHSGGDFANGNTLDVALDPTAQLDIFVKGKMCITQPMTVGSPNYPANARVYIGNAKEPDGGTCAAETDIDGCRAAGCDWDNGSGSCIADGGCTNTARAFTSAQAVTLSANFYAPTGVFNMANEILVYGGVFSQEISGAQPLTVHYDRAVVDLGDICPDDCGNNTLDDEEVCDGTALNGRTCQTEGFDGGVLLCDLDCGGFNTDNCTVCGDSNLDPGEVCEVGDTAPCDEIAAVFDSGTATCTGQCAWNTNACTICGNGVIEAGELCDGGDLAGATCTTQGYDGGTLGCSADCTALVETECYACGDSSINGSEECDASAAPPYPLVDGEPLDCADFGYTAGNISCRNDCTVNRAGCTACGNFIQEAGEECDNDDLNGLSCTQLEYAPGNSFDGGTLACDGTCGLNTDGCYECGDGVVEGPELCETGDTTQCDTLGFVTDGPDGGTEPDLATCSASCGWDTSGCTSGGACGNGVREGGEQCDPGSDLGSNADDDFGSPALTCDSLGFPQGAIGTTCNADCTVETSGCANCGNGTIESGEECDGAALPTTECSALGAPDDFTDGTLSCRVNCTYDKSDCGNCGNGVIDGTEVCDGTDFGGETCQSLGESGGTLSCDACGAINTDNCFSCGDGEINGSEACDPSADPAVTQTCVDLVGPGATGTASCTPGCTIDATGCDVCGNNVIEGVEECDGTALAGASCTDFEVPGEPGNFFDGGTLGCGDTGGAACMFDTSGCFDCGNGTIEAGEDCEPGEALPTDCGGLGFDSGTLACNLNCSYDVSDCAGCGDGQLNGSEECDGAALGGAVCANIEIPGLEPQTYDGGTIACDMDAIDDPETCELDTSGCYYCGDSNVNAGEQCDTDVVGVDCEDFGLEGNPSGCSGGCQLLGCTVPSACGDGALDPAEQCDPDTDNGGASPVFAALTCGDVGYSGTNDATVGATCNADCTIDTTACCGDGAIGGSEQCDGGDLGGTTCPSLPAGYPDYVGGTLGCSATCTFDDSGCDTCYSCRDCNNQACVGGSEDPDVGGECGSCATDADCCAPLQCNQSTGQCILVLPN